MDQIGLDSISRGRQKVDIVATHHKADDCLVLDLNGQDGNIVIALDALGKMSEINRGAEARRI